MSLRLVFAGTPEFAALHLNALLNSPHEVVAVYTQPDRPAGRGKQLQASEVKRLAQSAGLPVLQPTTLKGEQAQAQLAAFNADVLVVVAYGVILPQTILDTPRLGCLNVHASLLPRWRGAAPIQRAIEAGDTRTGITLMQMDAGLDTGAMLHTLECPIYPSDTAQSLYQRLGELGPQALLHTLNALPLTGQAQNNAQATYAHKLTKTEAQLNWQHSASQLALRIRAFNPSPMAFTLLNGQRLRVLQATALPALAGAPAGTLVSITPQGLTVACGQGQLQLEVLQLEGKKPQAVAALLNGQHPFIQGAVFTGIEGAPHA